MYSRKRKTYLRRSRTSSGTLAASRQLEQQLARAEAEPVSVSQVLLLDRFPVDRRPIGRAQVGDRPTSPVPVYLRVAATDVRIGEDDVVGRKSPNDYGARVIDIASVGAPSSSSTSSCAGL